MGLIKDEDFVAIAHRGEDCALPQLASVVDAVVAGRVNLDHVERATATARQLDAAGAFAAGGIGWALGAVEAAGQNSSGRGFATAARAREEVGVIYLV